MEIIRQVSEITVTIVAPGENAEGKFIYGIDGYEFNLVNGTGNVFRLDGTTLPIQHLSEVVPKSSGAEPAWYTSLRRVFTLGPVGMYLNWKDMISPPRVAPQQGPLSQMYVNELQMVYLRLNSQDPFDIQQSTMVISAISQFGPSTVTFSLDTSPVGLRKDDVAFFKLAI